MVAEVAEAVLEFRDQEEVAAETTVAAKEATGPLGNGSPASHEQG